MTFKPHTFQELKAKNIQNDTYYKIEYINRDYFNGEVNLEISDAKAIVNKDTIQFIVTDPYGMEKFITEARVLL